MNDTGTIRIPADMEDPIEIVWGVADSLIPVHVVGASENPDEFCMAFYVDDTSESDYDNVRATMVAQAASKDYDMPSLKGDILVTTDPELAGRIVANDEEFQQHKRTVVAFRAWLIDYSEANGIDAAITFESIHCYVTQVLHNAEEKAKDEHAARVASLLGLDPSQVGVVFF